VMASSAELKYQWQVKRLWRDGVELGAQGFGSFGTWDDWSASASQEHSFGPAVFGKRLIGGGGVLRADAGLLIGVTPGSPRTTLRLRVQYEF
jgi:hypothetical protein